MDNIFTCDLSVNKVLKHSQLGLWSATICDGGISSLYGDEVFCELLGIKGSLVEENIYEYWYERIDGKDRNTIEDAFANMKKGRMVEVNYVWHHLEKGPVKLRLNGSYDGKSDDGIILCGYMQSIDSLFEQSKYANKCNKERAAFLNNFSHDIRTPINTIVGFTALANSHIEEPELLKNYLEKIMIANNHLMALINDVLDINRIENGMMKLEEKECSLSDIMTSISDIIKADIEAKRIKLCVEKNNITDDTVYCDKLRLEKVILNFLNDAIKFTCDGGSISISIVQKQTAPDGYADYDFIICDSGIVMEENSFVGNIQSNGLGMTISKGIVDMMGGSINIDSKPGEGSKVIISLRMKTGIRKRILVVEDNELNRECVAELLKEYGFEIEETENGKAAVDRIISSPPDYYDVVLMDVHMPVMDGYEATRCIRQLDNPDYAKLPIIAMTANVFEEDKISAFENGMNGFISKPVDIEKLLKIIRDNLS